jgi:hypothetical protein
MLVALYAFLLSSCKGANIDKYVHDDAIYRNIITDASSIYLYDDSVIYTSYLDDGMMLYRYYLKEKKVVEIGLVRDFFVSIVKPTRIDNTLYIYYAIQGERIKNVLFSIDMDKNILCEISENYNSAALIPVSCTNDRFLAISNNRNSETNIVETSIQVYHPISGDIYNVIERTVDFNTMNGEITVGVSGCNEKITLFFMTNTNDYYLFNKKEGTLTNYTIEFVENHKNWGAFFDGKMAWITLFSEGDTLLNKKPIYVYANIFDYN